MGPVPLRKQQLCESIWMRQWENIKKYLSIILPSFTTLNTPRDTEIALLKYWHTVAMTSTCHLLSGSVGICTKSKR